MRYAIVLAAGALACWLLAVVGPAGAQETTTEPPAGPAAVQGQPAPAPLTVPPGILLAPQTSVPPGADPRGPVQSCPDQGQRLELIV
jgi:hypothetical protein